MKWHPTVVITVSDHCVSVSGMAATNSDSDIADAQTGTLHGLAEI